MDVDAPLPPQPLSLQSHTQTAVPPAPTLLHTTKERSHPHRIHTASTQSHAADVNTPPSQRPLSSGSHKQTASPPLQAKERIQAHPGQIGAVQRTAAAAAFESRADRSSRITSSLSRSHSLILLRRSAWGQVWMCWAGRNRVVFVLRVSVSMLPHLRS
eukprot:355058-Chlamydomonas_euryale.AAC.6